jgi:prepilin-type N-terminal cleavage/methylation domain-containing protein
MRTRAGFTLIELLIVVAIIAILAAIAVPNFLEAQARAKVARVLSDQRATATALESYRVDHNAYPGSIDVNTFITTNLTPGFSATPRINRLVILTTPIAYITSVAQDVFNPGLPPTSPDASFPEDRSLVYWGNDALIQHGDMDYRARTALLLREIPGAVHGDAVRDPLWALLSAGPDRDLDTYDAADQTTLVIAPDLAVLQPYDGTNGTVSDGDLVRIRE